MILNKIRSWNKLSILGISLMLLNNISCIDYEDNVNPNEVTEEMMEADNLKTGAFFSQMLRRVVIVNDGDKLDSDYQIAQNLSHDLYSGYIAATLGSTNHNGQYNFQEQWVNATFDYAYTGIMAPWQSIHKIATEQELPEVDALATIVKVEGMHRIADTFGPIPYVNYGSSSLYDALDLVYNKFFEELDNAIEVLSNYVNGNVDAKLMSDYDCVYGGKYTFKNFPTAYKLGICESLLEGLKQWFAMSSTIEGLDMTYFYTLFSMEKTGSGSTPWNFPQLYIFQATSSSR